MVLPVEVKSCTLPALAAVPMASEEFRPPSESCCRLARCRGPGQSHRCSPACRELPNCVLLIAVGRLEVLDVLLQISCADAGRADSAAASEYAPVRQQRGAGVVPDSVSTRQHRPGLGCWIPPLRGEDRVTEVDVRTGCTAYSAGSEHTAVSQDGEVVLSPSNRHRGGETDPCAAASDTDRDRCIGRNVSFARPR
jgi:hypothetical protein